MEGSTLLDYPDQPMRVLSGRDNPPGKVSVNGRFSPTGSRTRYKDQVSEHKSHYLCTYFIPVSCRQFLTPTPYVYLVVSEERVHKRCYVKVYGLLRVCATLVGIDTRVFIRM